MSNKNYISGRRKEYVIKHRLEKEGYIALRTAGSHGFCDIMGVHPDTRIILFIQSKPKKFSKKLAEEITNKFGFLKGDFKVAFSVE